MAYAGDSFALFAPQGSHFVVRTARGDLEKDATIERLLLWHFADVDKYLRADATTRPPQPTVIAEEAVRNDWSSVQGLRWISASEIAYLAPASDGVMQAFLVNVESRQRQQLTYSPTDVVSFAVQGDHVVYFALIPPSEENRRPTFLDVGGKGFFDIELREDRSRRPMALYHGSRSQKTYNRVAAPAVTQGIASADIWIAPSGATAINLTPAVGIPARWALYRSFVPEDNYASIVTKDATSPDLAVRLRFQLIDLRTDTVQPLMDAPAAFLNGLRSSPQVFWNSDESSVLVTQMCMPLRSDNDKEYARGPVIAEIDLFTRTVSPIIWEPWVDFSDIKSGKKLQDAVVAAEFMSGRNVLAVNRADAHGKLFREEYSKTRGAWRFVKRTAVPAWPLQVTRRESLNERPKLYVARQPGESRLLLDTAPKLSDRTFGRAEIVSWKDPDGAPWRGGLIYPVNYQVGKRYPLVVQTHGFSSVEFLIDGPGGATTSFAAQPLANAGFFVLQTGEAAHAVTSNREAYSVAAGYKAVIDKLIAEGLVDPEKVGLVAWSRTGYHAVGMLAAYPSLLSAVTIADSVQYGLGQLELLASDSVGLGEFERVTGSIPREPPDFGSWVQNNPLYAIGRSRAAVRLESIGEVVSMWETYAVLRLAQRPVDHVFYPDGSHNLQKPSERLISQGGTVDWFRFWLQGYEDPDPSKAAQYERWHRLATANSQRQ